MGAHREILDVTVRYATGIDCRDWDLFRTCFTEDCQADYGDIGTWTGAEAITAWMQASHDPLGPTLHRITNQAITRNGDSATARSYVDAIVMHPGNDAGTRAVGYYDDEFVDTGDGWKIARRKFTMVLVQPIVV